MTSKVFLGLLTVMVLTLTAWMPATSRAQVAGGQASPEEVVTAFYSWYLSAIGKGSALRNPLVDGAYRERAELTRAFVERIDEKLASFDKAGYDPILQAQDIPQSVVVGDAAISEAMAWVPVETDLGEHAIVVTLIDVDGVWRIDGVALAPEAVVRRFYSWYLWYIGRPGEMRNPLVDGAYRERTELAPTLAQAIDAALAGWDKAGFDPILMAQDIPVRIEVRPSALGEGTAQVSLDMFWGGNDTPSVRTVTLALLDGEWRITHIAS